MILAEIQSFFSLIGWALFIGVLLGFVEIIRGMINE